MKKAGRKHAAVVKAADIWFEPDGAHKAQALDNAAYEVRGHPQPEDKTLLMSLSGSFRIFLSIRL
jgi:hypothetical protein